MTSGFLPKKVTEENGLKSLFESGKLEFTVSGLEYIIKNHTMYSDDAAESLLVAWICLSREVGVRGLERCLSSICRHCATLIAEEMEARGRGKGRTAISFPRSSSSTNKIKARNTFVCCMLSSLYR